MDPCGLMQINWIDWLIDSCSSSLMMTPASSSTVAMFHRRVGRHRMPMTLPGTSRCMPSDIYRCLGACGCAAVSVDAPCRSCWTRHFSHVATLRQFVECLSTDGWCYRSPSMIVDRCQAATAVYIPVTPPDSLAGIGTVLPSHPWRHCLYPNTFLTCSSYGPFVSTPLQIRRVRAN